MTGRISFFLLLAALLLCGSAHAQYIALELESNGLEILGEPSRTNAGGEDVSTMIEVLSFQFDVERPLSSDGRISGSVAARPFRFVKRVNRASPLILQSLVQSELVNGVFHFFGNSIDGAEIEAFQITFTNGRISRQTPWSPFGEGGGFFEAVEIAAETIRFTSLSGATMTEFEFSALGGIAR